MMIIANSHFSGNGRPQQYVVEPQQRDLYDDTIAEDLDFHSQQHRHETIRQQLLEQRTSIQNTLEEIFAHPQHATLDPGINQSLQRKICGVFWYGGYILTGWMPGNATIIPDNLYTIL
jgi:hypothetical protein